MTMHTDALRLRLATGPKSGSQIAKEVGLSQPTVSRALASMGDEVIKVGERRWTQYLLRDTGRGFGDITVYRVDASGKIKPLGVLTPVRPDGFVMTQSDGRQIHSDGLPWWLLDMRPQGYLGRAYAARYGAELGLPGNLKDWHDSHALRALLVHGHDLVGNLLLGDMARDKFLATPVCTPIPMSDKARRYAELAVGASRGESPGTSAGGEQPKFTAYADTEDGPTHVIVKFSEKLDSPVSQRWRDLLLAEHLALTTLRHSGIAAAKTSLIDDAGQRFLEVERFDRVGALGRRALISLGALDAEFVGAANEPWPVLAKKLAAQGTIDEKALGTTQLLWAFGTLIGNSDMHNGNLSFVSEQGRPYEIAPAYDMTPMAFAPTIGGGLPTAVHTANVHASVPNDTWRQAETLARTYLAALADSPALSHAFQACIGALKHHIDAASQQIDRLASA